MKRPTNLLVPTRQGPPQPSLRRLLVGRAFPPQPGGRLPIECYVDVRIVGDGDSSMFDPFTNSVLEAFDTRIEQLGWMDGEYQRNRVTMNGDVEVVEYLAKNALGQVAALSQAAGRSFLTLGEPPVVNDAAAGEMSIAFAGVLPTEVAAHIHGIIRLELARRGHKFASLDSEGANGQEKAKHEVDAGDEHGRADRPDSEPTPPHHA